MKILLIEDEFGISSFIQQGLEEEGYHIRAIADGKEGLDVALKNRFDLIILDWMLPGIEGIEICKEIRSHHILTPIIFLTARDTAEETIMGLQAGANDYIKKPFHFEELLERIKVHFRKGAAKENKLELGSLSLDPNTYEVSVAEKQINLTQREFDLLRYLMSHADQVCIREAIIREVWNIHFEYDSSIIDVYINSIRKKLANTSEKNLIQTVRGVGYIIKDPKDEF